MIFQPQAKLLRYGSRVENFINGKIVYPILLEVDPTGYCNAKCPWCFYRDEQKGISIDADELLKSIHDLKDLKAINWTGGGEPTLHPDFRRMVRMSPGL